jgi:hypothetical protein
VSSRRGKHWEHKAVHELERQDHCCTVAGGSLGVFDIIAIGAKSVRCIQVKGGARPALKKGEREAIVAVKVPPKVTKEVWYYTKPKLPGQETRLRIEYL